MSQPETTDSPGTLSERRAQALFGTMRRALAFYNKQLLDHLNPAMRAFVTQQEMVMVATADARGECDSTFRAGPPGFVQVLGDRTLAFPEYRGNGVLASIGNIIENPHIGLLFIDFTQYSVGLHVNGAAVLSNHEIMARLDRTSEVADAVATTGGRRAECWVLVEVREAYIHCSKHIPLLQKLDKAQHWGTDDEGQKGGDFFGAKSCSRPWVQENAKVPARTLEPTAIGTLATGPQAKLLQPCRPVGVRERQGERDAVEREFAVD